MKAWIKKGGRNFEGTDDSRVRYARYIYSLGGQACSQTLYLPLPATRGGKGLAHSNIANGSELHRKAVEEIRPHSMNLIKNGTCQNDFCASESYLGGYFTHE